MKKRRLSLLIAMILIISTLFSTVNAETQNKDELRLTIEEAVGLGIENSIDLRLVKNEIDLSGVKDDRAEYLSDKLEDGDERLSKGKSDLSKAKNAIDNGIAPKDINLGNGFIIKQGQSIDAVIDSLPLPTEDKEATKIHVKTGVEQEIAKNKENLELGELSLTQSLQDAGDVLSGKLNFDSLDALGVDSTSDLMSTMASVSYEVTKASYDIYKNQIAMLIQKNYYDVLKAQKILEVKKKAMDRGEKQFEFSRAGYEEGMKAKDDMLVAEVYYKGTQLEYKIAESSLKNALIQLKKSINIPLNTKVVLTNVLVDDREIPKLEEGIKSGIENRLEIKKALGEVGVYDLSFEKTRRKYPSNTFQHKEAKLLKEKARINYEKTYLNVESSVRQSYEKLISTGEMMEIAKGMIDGAKENVEIAEYKYQEGFGLETSLLKKLNIESSGGTIIEVLAAEETLADVEEKVVEIIYGYNLAKIKYYNDIGKLLY